MRQNPNAYLSDLTPDERIESGQASGDSAAPEDATAVPLTDEQWTELERRMEAARQNPKGGYLWEEVRDHALEVITSIRRERGRWMADALRCLAEGGAFSHIEDPVEWQREARRDRPLPGRDVDLQAHPGSPGMHDESEGELEPLTDEERRWKGVEALERIAERGGMPSIPDAAAWQREIREDRPLPGREDDEDEVRE